MKIAVCVGHDRKRQGAKSPHFSHTEYEIMVRIAPMVADMLRRAGHDADVIDDGLTATVDSINAGGYDLAIDLHLNADGDHTDPQDMDDSRGKGAMVMYMPGSDKRRVQAHEFCDALTGFMHPADDRWYNLGAREGYYWGGDNPGTIPDYFLRKTNCPAFIPEPFYIDNKGECSYWIEMERHETIAKAIAFGVLAIEDSL